MKLSSKILSFLLITLFFQSFAAQQTAASISTVPEAVVMLRKIIINIPAGGSITLQDYEKQHSGIMVKCAKILHDSAYAQILDTLQEIDNRIAYWRYQKNHPWGYFLAKNPMKWVMGASQDVEIGHNLEELQSHQGELYVLLGQLAEYGNAYDHKHKSIFRNDYMQAYAWVDGLLDLLIRIKVSIKNLGEMSPFMARTMLLKAKLERVRFFKNQLLAEIKETQIPTHLERNWFTYGAAAAVLGIGYQVNALEKLVNAFTYVTNGVKEHIITPVENVMKDVFGRGNHNVNAELLVSQEDINIAKNTITEFLENLLASGDITAEKKKEILGTIELGNSTALLELMNQLWNSGFLNKSKFFTSAFLWSQFKILTIGKQLQEKFANIEKQYIGIGKIAVLTPAVLSSWFAHGRYQAFTTKDYSSIRRALIDINSLFVDTAKPLDDESYGKMLYVIYNLKKRAEKDVPLVDRADFIQDLERIESKEFDVAAKRRIIEDMFRKYSFLKLA